MVVNMSSDSYLFGKKDVTSERLTLINSIYNPYSEQFITQALKTPQGRVLEIACGPGLMSCWFAKQDNITSMLGIDIDAAAVANATALSQAEQLTNTEFKVLSVYDLDLLEGAFDIIYLRFILIHLTNPTAALRAIYNKLKPNGVMICETAIHSHCFSDPKNNSYDQFIKIAMQTFASQGKDCDLGKQIYSLCRSQQFSVEHMHYVQPLLRTVTEKKTILLGFQSAKEIFNQNKLATSDVLNALENQMAKDYLDTDCIWAAPTLCQVSARK